MKFKQFLLGDQWLTSGSIVRLSSEDHSSVNQNPALREISNFRIINPMVPFG